MTPVADDTFIPPFFASTYSVILAPRIIGEGGALDNVMPCLLTIFVLIFPRIALVLMFLFTHYLGRAYHGFILPVVGFFFLPLTTLVYAWMVNTGRPTVGGNLLILIIAVVIDLGGLSGGEYHRRRR